MTLVHHCVTFRVTYPTEIGAKSESLNLVSKMKIAPKSFYCTGDFSRSGPTSALFQKRLLCVSKIVAKKGPAFSHVSSNHRDTEKQLENIRVVIDAHLTRKTEEYTFYALSNESHMYVSRWDQRECHIKYCDISILKNFRKSLVTFRKPRIKKLPVGWAAEAMPQS